MFKPIIYRLGNWLAAKAAPRGLIGNQWTGTGFVDSFKRNRNPTANELMAELKATAWTCASINAAVCASFPPRLYVSSTAHQAEPKCEVKTIHRLVEQRLRAAGHLLPYTKSAARIQEVVDHPLLTLLDQVNPIHNAFDLWELTTLYQEVHGSAFWFIGRDLLGIPAEIWILPSQNVTPKREPDSPNIVDYYEYRTGASCQRFEPSQCIQFRYPNPRDPYNSGLSPLQACFEQVSLSSEYTAFRQAKLQNRAIPDAIISPDEVLGEEERDRLEAQWNQKFRRGGAGRVVVGETNLANLQAAEHQHMSKAIAPRLRRRDEKLNEQLIPLFDPSRRLFLASEDPVPINRDFTAKEKELDLKYGVVSINEDRMERGLDPVPWGWTPWLPGQWKQT